MSVNISPKGKQEKNFEILDVFRSSDAPQSGRDVKSSDAQNEFEPSIPLPKFGYFDKKKFEVTKSISDKFLFNKKLNNSIGRALKKKIQNFGHISKS